MKRSLPWIVAGVAVVALVVVEFGAGRRPGVEHPTPRPGITAGGVLPASLVPNTPGALEAYDAARRVPRVLDGLYCHCDCSKSFGHRSLLTCFESEHGARCDICMGEATLADQLGARGTSLDEIRRAIDAKFGT